MVPLSLLKFVGRDFTVFALYTAILLHSISSSCCAWKDTEEKETFERDAIFSRLLKENEYPSKTIRALQYASIPIISGIVGFVTNWIALKMTFFPVEFWGIELLGKYSRCKDQPIGCIGWQGIVPTKAGKMAMMSVRLMTEKVFNVKEIFLRIDPSKAAIHMKAGFSQSVGHIVDEISDGYMISKDTKWKITESVIKAQVKEWVFEALPSFTEAFMSDLVDNLDDVFDLEDMCVTEMVKNKMLLNAIFLDVGRKELIFIRNSGFYFGFALGFIQLLIWYFYPTGWVLPAFGFVVGYATNFLALKMIFKPVEPYYVDLGCYKLKLQGLFLQRQKQASYSFARKIVGTVMHSEKIWHAMLHGPKAKKFRKLLNKHLDGFTDSIIGNYKPVVNLYLGEDKVDEMKVMVRQLANEDIETTISFMHEYTDDALDLEREIATKMSELSFTDFEQVLHPVFEEDEFKLIIVGAILGALVGLFQLFVIFGV
uniref:DUF445 domain-containing protein n=1 Tax=Aplanochytrium stocchinoi TaxID=215587 RepID=A0A7S3PNH8_9STRA|mmetsp:Transcript_5230/g.6590  ORF Transcript_5230/g.6590 Transcript_5230/m.6590 type:complete len:483 (+) Transcript_5230:160-1608(+)|eukprot:CAMPEP_0204827966 /NCGR_PEP_ID=MMETSP1346-20131115/5523_1 /ASSEMBLY_ACC=CAM_ASM_000771 /TAXON_ID=215587 /ORGANISM="Aplanochytrium stocchinoi, Strain GSBS06" /LENGTH=482 /DNA_ID=CAMNT_0051956685 /DNA_START=106 /DNA_END=1554 /DNA_ORIENTATION=+